MTDSQPLSMKASIVRSKLRSSELSPFAARSAVKKRFQRVFIRTGMEFEFRKFHNGHTSLAGWWHRSQNLRRYITHTLECAQVDNRKYGCARKCGRVQANLRKYVYSTGWRDVAPLHATRSPLHRIACTFFYACGEEGSHDAPVGFASRR